MKTFGFIRFLLLVASATFMVQCTSDPIPGPPGADGIDGIDGIDGMDGVDGTTSCINCHSNAYREPILLAYSESAHANLRSFGASATCARCHNDQGFQDYLSNLYIDSLGFATANPDGYDVPDPISCTTCHDMHRSFNFEEDGNDKAVRSITPVDLFLDPDITIDIRNASDELGLSNLCVNCHQPRNQYDIPGPTADFEITSSRFGPHHGPQSTMLEGIFGANISGALDYPGRGSAGHRQGSSCIACHMGPTTNGSDGGHTWEPTTNTCLNCHTGGPPSEVDGFEADFDRLRDLLIAAGSIAPDSSAVLGVFPANVAQATWNWRMLMEDKSMGVHNPNYAKALLKNSIEALEN
ncbi:hypothetical protein [Robiginitalea sp. SC105]|uniref:hypothetical protein n=1 Tax=Robiginitalea sp. SC105 TaxID=2762332 RepID=UPI00163AF292|nr:hypothetical protein [Robiginitalea sp. SC105]MBC2839266.1 hypothetical protein [Robiginitalea sp. SC105]